jgi:hypothetical protein
MSPIAHISSRKSPTATISGAAAIMLALIVVSLGAGALWLSAHRDHHGYVSLGPQTLQTVGRTVTTPSLVTGDYIPHWLIGSERVTVSTIDSARPVLIRIARSGSVGNATTLAQARGRGPVTLTWKPEPGRWNVVVTNADRSPGVNAQVSLAAKLPPLVAPGLILIAVGLAVGAGGCVLVGRDGTAAPAKLAPRPAVV